MAASHTGAIVAPVWPPLINHNSSYSYPKRSTGLSSLTVQNTTRFPFRGPNPAVNGDPTLAIVALTLVWVSSFITTTGSPTDTAASIIIILGAVTLFTFLVNGWVSANYLTLEVIIVDYYHGC